MKLLVSEYPVVVLPSLAKEIGLNEAIVLQQIHYWSLRKETSDDGEVWIYKTQEEWLDELTWMSPSTLKRALRGLRKGDLIETKQPDGTDRRTYLRVLYENVPDGVKLTPSMGSIRPAASDQSDPMTSNNSETTTEKTPTPKKKTARTVNRKRVTDEEFALAAAVVQLFNSSAGTSLSVDAHLTPIVGRIREHPSLTEGHHRRIIEAVFAGNHWWTGPPTPKIIYGNPSIFEQSIEMAKAYKAPGSKGSDPNAERERVRREFREAEEEDADN